MSELAICCVAIASLMVATQLLLPIHFETNDDPCMALVSAGCGLNDAPDEHLPHMNIIVGCILKVLNMVVPGLPWYTFWLLTVQFFAFVAMLFAFRSRFDRTTGTLLFAFYFLTIGIAFCSRLQFTSTATTAALSAFVLLAAWSESETKSKVALGCAIVLSELGHLTRADGLFLISILSFTWLILRYGKRLLRERRLAITAAVLVLCLMIAAILSQMNGACYRSSDAWSHFYNWNAQILRFHYGFIRYTMSTEGIFRNAGWYEDDLEMMYLGNVGDLKIFDADTLKAIADQGASWHRVPMSPRILLEDLGRTLGDPICIPALALAPMAMVFLSGRAVRFRVLLLLLESIALMAALLIFGHLPPRVYLSILSAFTVFVLFDSRDTLNRISQKKRNIILTTLAIVGLIISFPPLRAESENFKRNNEALNTFISTLGAHSSQLYIAWVTFFPFEALSPFDNWPKRLSGLKLVSLSQYAMTPHYKSRLKEFNLRDLTESATRDDIFWIGNPYLNDKFSKYAQRHFHKDIEFVGMDKKVETDSGVFAFLYKAKLRY